MNDDGEFPSAEALQVELENAGYDIFMGAFAAISENLLPAYDGKPLGCFILKFGRVFNDRRTSEPLNEIRGELLEISVVSPGRVKGLGQNGLSGDVFIHPELPKYVKKYIRAEAKRVSALPLREDFHETISRRVILTEYSAAHFSGEEKSVDTSEYRADPIMLASGVMFAKEVLEYMKTELYARHPHHYTELYNESSDGYITHTTSMIFSARPPVNGQESGAWLKAYAAWLQNSIQNTTASSKNLQTAGEFIEIEDTAMDDGILLLHALEAIRRQQ